MSLYQSLFKRCLDAAVAGLMLVVLSPLFILVSIALGINNRGTPFFFQDRPGRHEKKIRIFKFKTMNDKTDAAGALLPDKDRITRLGAIIRKTSIDELPQLWNVLKGDMSLVGPRPLLYKYLPLYNDVQRLRHNVRPGITGWAQVNGRNSISWTEKFNFDVYYVKNVSFALDVRILFLTALKVVKREGVNQSAERPMQPFNGSN